MHFSAALLLESVQKVMSVSTQSVWTVNPYSSAEKRQPDLCCLHVWGGSSTQASNTAGGAGSFFQVCLCLCLCVSVWHCVWYSRMYVWTCVCVNAFVYVCCLDQGAVATARSASCVLVGELDSSPVALALPQSWSLDDFLHQLLKCTLNAVPGLSTRLWKSRAWREK